MDWMETELAQLADASRERILYSCGSIRNCPGYIERGEQKLFNLSSNDYLGLAQHPGIVSAMRRSLLTEGAGSGASRHVSGNRTPYALLEQALATWQRSDGAVVFANGYMANLGVIQALMGRNDVVFSDRLNHASIVDGVNLSRAEHARFRHNDMDHLRSLLQKFSGKRRKLIVTDAVFSMDGDQALLHELVKLKYEYGAMLMVDEAHSGGIYGKRGEGLSHHIGVKDTIDIHLGTFSKSFGVYGAYICGSNKLIHWLINHARPLIYSTALPPSVVSGISESLVLVQEEQWRRKRLGENVKLFKSLLAQTGFKVGGSDSPIVPIIIGDNAAALRFSRALEKEGIAAVAIRPPTVPEGTARIRFSLSAVHTNDELIDAAMRIERVGLQLGVLKQ